MAFEGIYVTGNIVVDTLVRPVDALPEWGGTTYVSSIETRLGGNACGAACAAALLGVPAKIAGMVGDDEPGRVAQARLGACGVDVTCLRVHAEQPTAATVGLVHSNGERLFFHVPGACGVFSIDDISFAPEVVERCRFFHYGSPFCLPAMRRDAAELLRRARSAGLQTSLDTDWDTDGEWASMFDPLVGLLDYLFVNTLEGERLTGSREPDRIADYFRERGVGVVIVKTGAKGCVAFSADERFAAPAFDVPVVDTTGAGDCFCGGFLAALCRGMDLRGAARFANAVAAQSIQAMGATDGLKAYAEIAAWLELRQRGQAGRRSL